MEEEFLVNVNLSKLIPHIVGSMTVEIRSASFIRQGVVMLDLESAEGMISIPVTAEGLANMLLGLPSLGPKKEAQIPAAVMRAVERRRISGEAATKKRALTVGQTRTYNKRRQRLVGFTDSGSVQEKPPFVARRTSHPDNGRKVWPIWENVE